MTILGPQRSDLEDSNFMALIGELQPCETDIEEGFTGKIEIACE